MVVLKVLGLVKLFSSLAIVLVLGGSVAVPVSLAPGSPDGVGSLQQAEAASKTGTYKIEYHQREADWYTADWGTLRSAYKVKVKSVKKGRVSFYLERVSAWQCAMVRSKVITAKLKRNRASFSYRTNVNAGGWASRGKGSLVLGKNYVKVKVAESWHEKGCKLGLGTGGWLKIKKGTHKKWSSVRR